MSELCWAKLIRIVSSTSIRRFETHIDKCILIQYQLSSSDTEMSVSNRATCSIIDFMNANANNLK